MQDEMPARVSEIEEASFWIQGEMTTAKKILVWPLEKT